MSSATKPTQKSALNIVMGAMTFGAPDKDGARVTDLKDCAAILDVFQSHGHCEVDTARVYVGGTSEEYLGKLDWQKRGLKMHTKLYPTFKSPVGATLPDAPQDISHTPESLRKHFFDSLKALNTNHIDMFYLHGPDRNTPYEVTLKAVNDLYKEGYFDRFGISNYTSWEVAEIVTLCRANGWIQPTAYQGIYNAIHRMVEPELFPCLRKFGISFYEFNPLGGGYLAGRYLSPDAPSEKGSRFDPDRPVGKLYRKRYFNDTYFRALQGIKAAGDKHGLTMAEIALRWVSHHSLMKREYGDSIIIGASSVKHIEQNLDDLEKGPLPEDVVQAVDEAWELVKPTCTTYHH
ncbi:Aldo/keto reductase [Gloeophyllum trabeum ATCC 11539]|uniref:Aldo/keto reductase n=1 Tax=Gloeophyllum trabeum (strain ATCC 11539 / FP-39264 / Madison 617) TaxID=670483 RepID=S7PV82_GLOTA|nr:Aldo/keto reductase [Gloeophyllum trabeum ATCC 11539]EPQ51526.1 Aldo/keto reductase [Gloeophyllum trabeum ATCC 11539]